MIGKNTKSLTVYIHKSIKEKLKKEAKKVDLRVSQYVENVLQKTVDKC